MKFAAILAICLLCGCDSTPQKQYAAQGIVRNVWCHPEIVVSTCDVVLEHDSGPLQTLTFYGGDVPLWTGLHAKINYHTTQNPSINALDWAERMK